MFTVVIGGWGVGGGGMHPPNPHIISRDPEGGGGGCGPPLPLTAQCIFLLSFLFFILCLFLPSGVQFFIWFM